MSLEGRRLRRRLMNVVTMLAGGSSLVLEEPKVDAACLVTLTFGNNVTEPRGSHLLELAVADGTGKVGTCRHRGPNNLGMWSERRLNWSLVWVPAVRVRHR